MLHIAPPELYSMDDALQRLRRMLGRVPDWRSLMSFLPPAPGTGWCERSAIAATFAASLELVRAGKLQLRQDTAFGPIYLRSPPESPMSPETDDADRDRSDHLRLVEALLFASAAPLDEESIAERLPDGADVAGAASPSSRRTIAPRGVNLVRVAGGWTFRTAPDLAPRLKLERKVGAQAVARRRSRRSPSSPITSR